MAARYSGGALAFFAALSLVLSGLMLWSGLHPSDGIPAKAALARAEGRVAWIDEQRYGTEFRLVGDDRVFDYPSKANGMGVVRSALAQSRATGEPAVVLFAPEEESSMSGRHWYGVWELRVDGRPVRTYEETVEAWTGDNHVGLVLGVVFLFFAGVLGVEARKQWRNGRRRIAHFRQNGR